jgi:EGF domain-containing protein
MSTASRTRDNTTPDARAVAGGVARRWLMVVVLLVLSSLTSPSSACSDYPTQVPNSDCPTCHQDTQTGPRNGFALDWYGGCVACLGTCAGCSFTPWSSCFISSFDSDGDGFTNDEELSIFSPPGEFSTIDECASGLNHCVPEATCSADGAAREDYTCVCAPGLDGVGSDGRDDGNGCVDVDECAAFTDDCGENSTCDNTPRGSFACPCDPGFFGDGHAGLGCSAFNYCDPDPCSPLASCQSLLDRAECGACPTGYEGDPFDPAGCTPVDACADGGGCAPQVTCNPLPGGRSCGACPAGWSGSGVGPDGCVEDVCAACSPFATCTPGGSPVCACNVGFTGDGVSCRDIDECAPGGSLSCGEHRECGNLFGSYLCVCAQGYHAEGETCVADASAWLVLLGMACGRRRRRGQAGLALGLVLTAGASLPGCGDDSGSAQTSPGGAAGASAGAGAAGSSGASGSGGAGGSGGVSGSGGTAGLAGSGGAAGSAPVARSCTSSRECLAGEWCNPSGDLCQRRDAPGVAITFQDVFEALQGLPCPTCHRPDGEGFTTSSGFGQLRFDDFELAYAHLVVDGVNCQTVQHRLCVEDPRSSLLITKVFEGLSDKPESVVFNDWADPQLQKILRWIASGAQRRGSCGNRVVDPGEECDQGLSPPLRCAYGEATCELCTPHCQLAAVVAGPRCGDAVVDEGHETCDDGNLEIEAADPNIGAVCGSQCTLVQGL